MKRLRMPSPSMVIALVALFFSVGGSAYALVITGRNIKNGTVTGKDIKNKSLASRDIKRNGLGSAVVAESKLGLVPSAAIANSLGYQAVVTSTGLLARHRGAISANRTAEGRYQVVFTRDVRGCAYMASIGDAGISAPSAGMVETAALASNVNGVSLRTQNSNGSPSDRPFHLIVSC